MTIVFDVLLLFFFSLGLFVSAVDVVFCMVMSPGLMKIKEAKDIEVRLNEVERLLKNTINMPWKVRNTYLYQDYRYRGISPDRRIKS